MTASMGVDSFFGGVEDQLSHSFPASPTEALIWSTKSDDDDARFCLMSLSLLGASFLEVDLAREIHGSWSVR